jgi:hypothetical protein
LAAQPLSLSDPQMDTVTAGMIDADIVHLPNMIGPPIGPFVGPMVGSSIATNSAISSVGNATLPGNLFTFPRVPISAP